MQRKVLIPLLAVSVLCSSAAFAQSRKNNTSLKSTSEETIILKRDGPRTVIEIRDGHIYVNGDEVATTRDNATADIRKKIIIEEEEKGGAGAMDDDGSSAYGRIDREAAPAAGRRAMLGVLTDARDRDGGALVQEVTPGSPAEEAGIRAGDRITRLDDKAIKDAAALSAAVGSSHRAGDRVEVTYERNGKTRTTTATLAAAPALQGRRGIDRFRQPMEGQYDMPDNNSFFREFRFPDNRMDDAEGRPRLGVSVEDMSDGNGVRVLRVAPASAAAGAGLRTGDVLTRVNGTAIESAAGLQDKISRSAPGSRITLSYQRNGRDATLDIVLPRPNSRKDL